ncbi:cytochrome P450, partial [Streptomyces sp. NPDC054901]
MDVVDIKTAARDFGADPHSFYAALRAAGPVHQVSGMAMVADTNWLVVGYEEARQALNHPDLLKDWRTSGMYPDLVATAAGSNMLESDPPHHTRLRRLVAREFTARRVEAMRPRGQRITQDQQDALGPPPQPSPHHKEALAIP